MILPALTLAMMTTFAIRLDRPRQTIDNFGASDCWTVESLMRWPEARRRQIADLLFDREKGAGLSAWRFNVGGGINHQSISNPMRTVDTFETSPGVYDWNRVPGQRWMLQAAVDRNVEDVILFANTPPMLLTRNGLTNGTPGHGSTNLRAGAEPEFARYLVDIADHFRKSGYPVGHVSPINEPDWEWNSGSQEGCRASNADIVRMGSALHDEIARRSLPIRVLGFEATSIGVGFTKNEGASKKYKSDYGDYASLLKRESAWFATIKPIYGFHDYWSDSLEQIVPVRRKLRAAFEGIPDLEVWHTEYCQMNGPRGEGGWGRDLGMTFAINVARLIHFDMTIVETRAWQWWLAVSDSDYKDGLIYVDDLDQPDGTIYASKALWALGSYSRFIRPGFRRLEVSGSPEDPNELVASAYRDEKSGRVVVVAINPTTSSREVTLDLPGKWRVRPYRTSDRPGEDMAPGPELSIERPVSIGSRSIVTFVADPNR